MKRQPRNPRTDKLVNERLISMAYGQIGEGGGAWDSTSGTPEPTGDTRRPLDIPGDIPPPASCDTRAPSATPGHPPVTPRAPTGDTGVSPLAGIRGTL